MSFGPVYCVLCGSGSGCAVSAHTNASSVARYHFMSASKRGASPQDLLSPAVCEISIVEQSTAFSAASGCLPRWRAREQREKSRVATGSVLLIMATPNDDQLRDAAESSAVSTDSCTTASNHTLASSSSSSSHMSDMRLCWQRVARNLSRLRRRLMRCDTSRPVRLCEFPAHVRLMSADSDFRFSEEYDELKNVGREQACSAADLPENRPKNRFTNILPYDHSRVKLQPTDDEEGSDYLNASYMPGFNSPREFIVAQGPLHSTRDDFWRAVWEQNCRSIIMLTRCIEKGREKCDHYWPYDTEPVYYGDIQVTIMNESQTPGWTLREFTVARVRAILTHFAIFSNLLHGIIIP